MEAIQIVTKHPLRKSQNLTVIRVNNPTVIVNNLLAYMDYINERLIRSNYGIEPITRYYTVTLVIFFFTTTT